MTYTPQNQSWFLERIGKRIYRDHHECCSYCDDVAENGLVIHDEQHAQYLADTDLEFGAEGRELNYRDEL